MLVGSLSDGTMSFLPWGCSDKWGLTILSELFRLQRQALGRKR